MCNAAKNYGNAIRWGRNDFAGSQNENLSGLDFSEGKFC
jgi:hypothetical protein